MGAIVETLVFPSCICFGLKFHILLLVYGLLHRGAGSEGL